MNAEKIKQFAASIKLAFVALTAIEQKFGEAVLSDGTKLSWDGDVPMPGAPVTATTADGQTAPAPDGTYQLEDGTQITVAAGLCKEVIPSNATPANNSNAANPKQDMGAPTPAAKKVIESIVKETQFKMAFGMAMEDMTALCNDCITTCQACIDSGITDPCKSACQACIDACKKCIADMSPENMAACSDACKKCVEACKPMLSDPKFGAVCTACSTDCQECVDSMGGQFSSELEKTNKNITALSESLAAFKTENDELKKVIAKNSERFDAFAKQTLDAVELLGEAPQTEEQKKEENFRNAPEPSFDEKMEVIRERIFKTKTK